MENTPSWQKMRQRAAHHEVCVEACLDSIQETKRLITKAERFIDPVVR